jgi:hypothetical protein
MAHITCFVMNVSLVSGRDKNIRSQSEHIQGILKGEVSQYH